MRPRFPKVKRLLFSCCCFLIFGPPSQGTSYKTTLCLSICLCVVQFGIFLSNVSLVFSDFLHNSRQLQYLRTGITFFSRRIHFPTFVQKGPKLPQNRVFWTIWKILPLIFPGNNLKWKLILLLIFHNQSHIWQNSVEFRAKMLLANQIAGFFKMISRKKWLMKFIFWHVDKYWSFLQVDIILGMRSWI